MMTTEKNDTQTTHIPLKKSRLDKISTGFLITSAALSLKKNFSQAITAAGYQISTEQYSVLKTLWRKDSISQSELGRQVFKDRHNVSRIVKGLEQKELITKTSDTKDGRLARCVLTEEGRALRAPLNRISRQVLKNVLQGMDEEKIRELKINIIHLLQNLGEDFF